MLRVNRFMAIDTEAARMLLEAARSGVSFKATLMLGRQDYLPGNAETRRLLGSFGFDSSTCLRAFEGNPGRRYAEPFFAALGASRIDSMDASSFEGATCIHDLNEVIPDALACQYDVVYDGGTLEHVFNFQQAIRNCMKLVRTGGRVILHTPANNFFGHGFFQFSPELFWRVFSRVNGFRVEKMVAMEYGPRRRWYEVVDPESVRARTTLVNSYPVLLFVQAVKVAEKVPFEVCPQQSDYSAAWSSQPTKEVVAAPRGTGTVLEKVKAMMIEHTPSLARFVEAFQFSQLNRSFSFRNRVSFRPFAKR